MKHIAPESPEFDDPGLSARELRDFFLQFSVMLSSGVPILDCLETLATAGYQRLGFVCARLNLTLATGHTLSGALQRMHHSFDRVIISIVAVGEKTGKLDLVLRELAKRVDERCRRRQNVIQALTYPATVMLVSAGLIILLSHSMLPVLLDLVEGMKVELPWPTRVLMFFVQAKWVALLGLALLVALAADMAWGIREETSTFRNWVFYESPVLGQLNRQRILLDLCNDLALMLEAGCLMTQALAALAPTCPDPQLSSALLAVRKDLQNGASLEESLNSQDVIPQIVSGSLNLGSEMGKREYLLRIVASLLQADLDSKVERLTALIEPLTMAVLGLVVGGILLASLLPIYSVVTSGI